jgi:HPt (histidine-containing phosphotransfer) domain-containing protein
VAVVLNQALDLLQRCGVDHRINRSAKALRLTLDALTFEGENMPDRVIVEVDQDLCDLIPSFLTHRRGDINKIFEAVARGDYEQISRIAHRFKGEGSSYGFDAMTAIGRSLELTAAIRDGSGATTLARQLLSYLDHVEIVSQPSKE